YFWSRMRIDRAIRSQDGLGWSWLAPYQKVCDFEWCGAFASFAWRAARIAASWRRSFFSSTYRLDLWARYLPFEKRPRDAGREVRQRDRDVHDHRRERDRRWPTGEHVRGVVRARRQVGARLGEGTYHARRLIRPALTDLSDPA